MTIGKGDRLLKVRGTNQEIHDRIRSAIFVASMNDGEVTPEELIDLLCPGEAYVEFEAISHMRHDGNGFPVAELKHFTPRGYVTVKDGVTMATNGDVSLAVLR